jgi:hypothetical protein
MLLSLHTGLGVGHTQAGVEAKGMVRRLPRRGRHGGS